MPPALMPWVARLRWRLASNLVLLLLCHPGASAEGAASNTLRARFKGVDVRGGEGDLVALVAGEGVPEDSPQSDYDTIRSPTLSTRYNDQEDTHSQPNAYLALRQSLLSYVTEQGVSMLRAHARSITVPEYEESRDLGPLGQLTVGVSDVKIKEFELADEDISLEVEQGAFHLAGHNASAIISFHLHWDALTVSGSLDGRLGLKEGAIEMKFGIVEDDEGHPQMRPHLSTVDFGAIDLDMHSKSPVTDWIYQMALALFKGPIRAYIKNELNEALRGKLPNRINTLLRTLPTMVTVDGLPFHMNFTYALYASDLIQVKGYISVASDDHNLDCPIQSQGAPIPEHTMLQEHRMASFYVQESVLQCAAWALYSNGLLSTTARDGDIPGVRLITSLFGVLIPGLPAAYPATPMQLQMAAASAPTMSFFDGSADAPNSRTNGGVRVCMNYTTDVEVLLPAPGMQLQNDVPRSRLPRNAAPGDAAAHGARECHRVARLAAEVCVSAVVEWRRTKVTGREVTYRVLESEMDVATDKWDAMVEYFLDQYGDQLSLEQLVHDYVDTRLTSMIQLQSQVVNEVEGHVTLSADIELHGLMD